MSDLKSQKRMAAEIMDVGKSKKECRRCGRTGRGVISKYDLNFCRQCFREVAEDLGFEQLK
ncbi:30S ribosomal protein S14P [Candidatus Haloredivivus sp. G17]|nr:30S ribosomal protein S14P [Candidatus Haloredivivus sp. G17]